LPQAILNALVDREAYRVCPLLTAGNFVSFCRARKMDVQAERLRQLERLGLFLPMLRIYRIDVPHKVEYVDDGRRYHDLGPLGENEAWDGALRNELAGFDFSQRVIRSWLEHRNAWDPRSEASPHVATIETEPRRHECYYSQFQIFELDDLLRPLTATVELEWALRNDGSIDPAWGDQLRSNLSGFAARVTRRDTPVADPDIGAICQIISDRYYPKTQGNERHVTIPMGGSHFFNWDWYAFARQWDAASVAHALNLDKAALTRIYERVFLQYRWTDPLENWQGLVRFIHLGKRQRLKDDALRAHSFGEMAKMLRLFHQDAFGEPLDAHAEFGHTVIDRTPDIMAEDDPLRALELVANDFGVNPKPQLVLFVEGATELMVVPLLFDRMYATTLGVFGIELVSVRGVSNATGGNDSSYSALWRLIDYLHHHQTIAFVLLDNEGLAPVNIDKGLRRAASIHFPDRRVTRPNYVKLWKLSFEMDNFNDSELAKALTRYAEGQARFSAADVKQCRESASLPKKNSKQRTLDVLYTERVGRNLNKPQFGRTLIELMFDPATKRKPQHRPIVRFLEKVAERAARNHQPLTHAMWEYNQRTGYFGTLRPGAVARRKNPFEIGTRKHRTSK
jgi:hypothetical protein